MVDACLEGDGGGLERVFGWEDKEKLEFSTLKGVSGRWDWGEDIYSVGRPGGAIEDDVPVVDVVVVDEADIDTGRRCGGHLCEFL